MGCVRYMGWSLYGVAAIWGGRYMGGRYMVVAIWGCRY